MIEARTNPCSGTKPHEWPVNWSIDPDARDRQLNHIIDNILEDAKRRKKGGAAVAVPYYLNRLRNYWQTHELYPDQDQDQDQEPWDEPQPWEFEEY